MELMVFVEPQGRTSLQAYAEPKTPRHEVLRDHGEPRREVAVLRELRGIGRV